MKYFQLWYFCFSCFGRPNNSFYVDCTWNLLPSPYQCHADVLFAASALVMGVLYHSQQ